MVRSHSLMPRRPDVSEAEFHAHWLDVHGPLALGIDTLRRYVQAHRLPAGEAFDTTYDGVAEVWLKSLEEGAELRRHPVFVEHLEADELEFVDVPSMLHVLTTEHPHDGEPPARDEPGVKVVVLLRGALGDGWLESDEREAGRAVGATRHTRNTALAETGPAYDAIRELWFPDEAAATGAADADATAWRLLTAPPGADPVATKVLLTREHRLIWP